MYPPDPIVPTPLHITYSVYLGGPVADREEVLGEERVALQRVDGPDVPRVHCHHLLLRRLGFTIARHDRALLRASHELGRLQRHTSVRHNMLCPCGTLS